MKVTTETPKPEFTPRSITITFESQAELDALTCILAYGATSAAAKDTFGIDVLNVYRELKGIGGNIEPKFAEFRANIIPHQL